MGPVGRLVENAARGMLPTLSFATFASASKPKCAAFACCGGATDSKFASARRFAFAEGIAREGRAREVVERVFKGTGVMPFPV